MNVRAQISMVFHLDKCIGCHTCSVACKNIWTDRKGAEYMWWNNVETKPGTGFPVLWEDQKHHKGGWDKDLNLKSQSKADSLLKLFYNPNQPGLDDYYEPWTYQYQHLFQAKEGKTQPTAIPVSQVTGEPVNLTGGPNWDDDLGGSKIYAANDPNLEGLSEAEKEQLREIERVAFFYLPRICNHCINPSCVAACPSGALYKRGEDGVVLVNQEVCKGWRACVSACPYKKVYYNWKSGKSEKCVLCYPRIETGQAPACFHSCVGRIRYMGVLLYDADRIPEVAKGAESGLVDGFRSILLNPDDPEVIAGAVKNGVAPDLLEAARNSPVYQYVVKWRLALPLHVEFRTLPMLFYVPPLLPVLGKKMGDPFEPSGEGFFTDLDNARIPIKYLARLFGAGNEEVVKESLTKLMAVRLHMRSKDRKAGADPSVASALRKAGLDGATAEEIYALTTLADRRARYAIPAMKREEAISGQGDVEKYKGHVGIAIPPGIPTGEKGEG